MVSFFSYHKYTKLTINKKPHSKVGLYYPHVFENGETLTHRWCGGRTKTVYSKCNIGT